MATSIIPSAKARFAPADAPFCRTVSDWGIRSVSAWAAAAHRVAGPCTRGKFGILLYHRIADEVAGIEKPTINVSPRQFEYQIRGLVELGFVFWPLSRVLDVVGCGERVPPYVVVLTFDDGFEGVYRSAWPVLRRLNIPATVFLATAYLDRNDPFPFDHWGHAHWRSAPPAAYRPMTVAQCRELADSGLIELGAHTHTHEDFRGRPTDFREDLRANVTAMKAMFGLSDVTFAFPYGTPRLGFVDESLTAAAREVGVRCALTTRSCLVKPDDSPFAWGRFTVFPWDDRRTLAAKLGGWYGWAPELKNRLLGQTTASAKTRQANSPSNTRHSAPATSSALSTCSALRPASSQRPYISVIVPTYNRADWLGDALQSLARQRTAGKFEFEIVVCDNASTDATAEVVASLAGSQAAPIRYCYQSKPGDAPTRNLAVREAAGQWLAFFDDDQLAPENWLHELFTAADKTGGPIVGGAVQLELTERERAAIGPYVCEALRETKLYAQLQPYLRRDLPGTGNALVARSVFDAIGEFDESLLNGGSDYDFFTRARAAGVALWYNPEAVIRHRVDRRRLSREHLRLDALSGGADHAEHLDYKRHGLGRVVGCGIARIGQALLVHGPFLAAAWLQQDRGQFLGHRIRLWRTEGYLRKGLALAAPRLFPQQRFFDSMCYRHGRPNTKGLS